MAWRLGPRVIRGQIFNTRRFHTHGWFELRGWDHPLHFELIGDPAPDLQGRSFYLTADPEQVFEEEVEETRLEGLQPRQIGPTGTMTADAWVRAIPCSAKEFYIRSKAGEQPPTEWKRHLYLEWFSQNGRVVVELVNPKVEICLRKGDNETDDGDWEEWPMTAPKPAPVEDMPPEDRETGMEIEIIQQDENGIHIRRMVVGPKDNDENSSKADGDQDQNLQQYLDSLNAEAEGRMRGLSDEEIRKEQEADKDYQEMVLMDDLMETSDGESFWTFLDHPETLPDPDTLDDTQVEAALKGVLAELALASIAIDICEHFSPRDVYTWLLDSALRDGRQFPEMVGSGWVTHHSTYESCPECEKIFEAEYEDLERNRQAREEPGDDCESANDAE